MQDNIEQLDDGSWKATCPYDGEEFEADTKIEALTNEGAYRAENFIEVSDVADGDSVMFSIVDDWRRQNQEVAASS